MKLIGVGDNVVDYYLDRNEIYPGGNALNVAVLSRRHGADKTGYIGILGNDQAAEHITQTLKKEHIDISRIRKGYGENGMARVKLNQDGDRIFVKSNQGGIQKTLRLHFCDDDMKYIKTFDLLHTSVYSLIEDQLPKLSHSIDISFDFSTKSDDSYLAMVCPYITCGFFSGSHLAEDECDALANKVQGYGTKLVGITRGSEGALFFEGDRKYTQPVVPTDVVDTLGAGDSFLATFLTDYYNGVPMEHALKSSAAAAAKTCTYYGAFGYGLAYGKAGCP
ncbi:fructoselysine 6-kinase [Scopulibacillus darangshiensis]|uniref:Fructoselysine 6-kinase n=1 Tax=Scopulibacillus darangshiensis TaxID=442528 RepID=A0A4R2NHC3_9BACL|nr:PfkB family carbohydrate kinase [Scopulibacillus darangshiensis]TCP20777.1 fructoselysine 6-kinase [Scopulibacillus darangshiensis]